MIIFPAIDLKNGECVRLYKGEFDTVHKVAESYIETAKSFKDAGAEWIHMIDLDGAKNAERKNSRIIIEVAQKIELKVQAGGGIRTLSDINYLLERGISRVIIGSAAVKNPAFVKEAVKLHGEKIAVGIDARKGKVATEGWTESSKIDYIELALQMCEAGVKCFIFTDIEKDGTLSRPNHFKTKLLQEKVSVYNASVIASGGIKSIENIKTLKKNKVYGAICGKSIYSGTLDLRQAIAFCKGVK
ncbi:MAG: 1-(5-phosphoribosyl)-5-[(5-phosphoribosylamino)methylideneamino]imidazole-4-carboxamide isomerase [Oscillospiraceae bacterium]|nr:1-(5-phosphoribosyl)-5-[(5-phosphoribosylamino)methylideneamino]imidazole-4-carboxamide isomerase [Oscillospiraceae bacterium]